MLRTLIRVVAYLRQLAERTPASRNRYVDLLRALAISAVVLGHWLISVVGYDARGQLTGHSALESFRWAYPITWLFQVMPLFFIVGGFANAASLNSLFRHGGDWVAWLQDRGWRLLWPTTALMVVLGAGSLVAQLLGVPSTLVRLGVFVASIPLWFLSAYLAVVVLTPFMYRLHRRFGIAVLIALVVLVAVGDVVRLAGTAVLGFGNFVFGWLAIHQIGFFWRDGRLPFTPRVGLALLSGGLTALVLLTVVGPYPVSLIDVPGQRIHNAAPPTLALLAGTAMQVGLLVLLRDRAERWLHRPRAWQAVVGVNMVVLTVFLWHLSAVLVLVGLLNAVHALPTPAVATTAWWLWRLPWLMMLIVVLAALVAVFGRVEIGTHRRPRRLRHWRPRSPVEPRTARATRGVLTVTSLVAAVYGLLSNNLTPRTGHYLFGMPAVPLAAFLAGTAVLRLLQRADAR